jgi:hypothetical protein
MTGFTGLWSNLHHRLAICIKNDNNDADYCAKKGFDENPQARRRAGHLKSGNAKRRKTGNSKGSEEYKKIEVIKLPNRSLS